MHMWTSWFCAANVAAVAASAYAIWWLHKQGSTSQRIVPELYTEGQSFTFVPLPGGLAPKYVDVWSDPVEGVRKLDVGTTTIGGFGAHHRLHRGENEYQSAGSNHFDKPTETLKENYPNYTAWRLEAMDLSNVERATIRYNQIRYGKRYHVFQIRIKRFNDAQEKCYGITEEEYWRAYLRRKQAGEQPPASIQRVFQPSAAPNTSVALLGFCGKAGDSVDELIFVFSGTVEASRLADLENDQRERNIGATHPTYDVFISHAGPDKQFAEALHRDLTRIHIKAFLDKVELLPADRADKVMLDAASKAPVGIAIFSPAYFERKWPMIELKVLVSRGVLLPVNFRFNNHAQYERSLRSSPHAHPSARERRDFLYAVEHTTYAPHVQGYTEHLQMELCWHVLRLLTTKAVPALNNSVASAMFMDRMESAAAGLLDVPSFPHYTAKQREDIQEWVRNMQDRRKQLQNA